MRVNMKTEFIVETFDSVKQINHQEWHNLIDVNDDVAMDLRLIHLLETTLQDQAQFWTVIVRDQQRQLVACACLSLFSTDIVQSATGFAKTAVEWLRSLWPNALKLKVLFCGLPLPSGETHLRIRYPDQAKSILTLIKAKMQQIAAKQKAHLLVFKEMDEAQKQQFADLQDLGFILGELEPVYQLSRMFKDFNEYQQALRSSYRHQIRKNCDRFSQAGLQVEHLFDPDEIFHRFNDGLHQLYLNVWSRAKEKLECFSLAFFKELPRALPHQVSLTLIKDVHRPVAFAIGIHTPKTYHNLYIGLDYSYLENSDLYFNLFYHELDFVFRASKKNILLGQTSGFFKSRLGATPESRYFWVYPLNPMLRLIFTYFKSLIFPKVDIYESREVFKEYEKSNT